MKSTFAVAGFVLLAAAQPRLATPRIGMMLDSQGALRPVAGVAGSLLVGAAKSEGVSAFACAAEACATLSAGPAVVATDGTRAVAFVAQAGEFLGWNLRGRYAARERLPWTINGGVVLSICLTHEGAEIAVQRDNRVWIVSPDGAAIEALPDEATGPVLLTGGGAVYATDQEVVLRRRDGTETRFAVAGVRALNAMSPDWVQIVAGGAMYALRTAPSREALYMLPQGEP
jgi:hypothetical protein